MSTAFHNILKSCWEVETIPSDFRDPMIVSFYKNKGSKVNWRNYSGISVLTVAGKIFAWVILNCLLSSFSNMTLPEVQNSFCPNWSIIDMIFTVRQIQEKGIEQNMHFHMIFINLTKAFNVVNREALVPYEKVSALPRYFPGSWDYFTMT